MSSPRVIVVVACAGVVAACGSGQSAEQDFSHADIAHVAKLKSSFGSEFKVTTVGPTAIDPRLLGLSAYVKPSVGLQLLRQEIMGPEAFDDAFRTYIQRWAFKHPSPTDFYRTMEDVGGRRLDWFWREWFKENPHFDQAIDTVRSDPGARREIVQDRDAAAERRDVRQRELDEIFVNDERAARKTDRAGGGRGRCDALRGAGEISSILGLASFDRPFDWNADLKQSIHQAVGLNVERGNHALQGVVHRDNE